VSACDGGKVWFWDVEAGEANGALRKGHTILANLVTFSPDGTKMASTSANHTVQLWDMETREAVGDPFFMAYRVDHFSRILSRRKETHVGLS
jgi:WD40 repeat protein